VVAVALRERPVSREELGAPLGALKTGAGLRIHRGGQAFGFWEPEARELQPGDLIIEVVPVKAAAPERKG
jgi:voltage-gated potassium channel